MKIRKLIYLLLVIPLLTGGVVNSQSLVKKLKDKAEDKALKSIFGEGQNSGNQNSNSGSSNTGNSSVSGTSGVQNTQGGGLDAVAPDVKENLKSAKDALASKQYGEARFSVRQAIMGIELEMGENVLKTLPETVDGLPYEKESDKVTSTGIGFVGLTIERYYRTDEKQVKVEVANDAAMLSGVNMYLNNGGYATTSNDKSSKVTKFKTYRAVIRYDEGSGYTLSVPFGQTSLMVIEGSNYPTETAFMGAANQIDLDKIKSQLGEQ
jgi:hypothetical protein